MGPDTELQEKIANLEQRLRLQELLSDISAILVDLPAEKVDDQIENALKRIVQFLGIDRSSFMEVYNQTGDLQVTHSYASAGIEPYPRRFMANQLPWYVKTMLRGETIRMERITDLPAEAVAERAYCETSGLKSQLSIPVSVGGFPLCVMGVASFRVFRSWPDSLVEPLKRVGEVFAHAIYRKRAEERLMKSFEEIRSLKSRLEAETQYLRSEITVAYHYENIVGESRAIRRVLRQVEQVAKTDSSVLLLGETGTGKELIARAIHDLSSRKDRAMVKVNCASLPHTLVESELFGREKGAYTGALTKQVGRFELADGSTIFLDEIGELSLELQTKLLRVLQEGELERLGSPRTVKVNVRVIAATNRALADAVRAGSFREDLYYRLNVFPILVPPLRDRTEDIPLLVTSFLNEFNEKMGKNIATITKQTMETLLNYPWPGNVRELRNIVEHGVIISNGKVLQLTLPQDQQLRESKRVTLHDVERKHITQVLEMTDWTIKGPKGAAKILGLKPSTLYNKMHRLGIATRRSKAPSPG